MVLLVVIGEGVVAGATFGCMECIPGPLTIWSQLPCLEVLELSGMLALKHHILRHPVIAIDWVLGANDTCRERIVDLGRLRSSSHERLDVLLYVLLLSLQVSPGLLSGIEFFIGIMVDIETRVEDVALDATGHGVDVSANELSAELSEVVLELIVEHR